MRFGKRNPGEFFWWFAILPVFSDEEWFWLEWIKVFNV